MHKKYSRSFVKKKTVEPLMSHVLTTFLDLKRVSCVAVYAGSESSRISSKNILICVPKINEDLMGLEQHEGEQLMTEFHFWVNFN